MDYIMCACGHKMISHRYIPIIGMNCGECLSPKCQCKAYETKEES